MEQKIEWVSEPYDEITDLLKKGSYKKIFLVCDGSIHFLKLDSYFTGLENDGFEVLRFDDFRPNPDYQSVVSGVRAFTESNSELIIAVGGGSAMDVAKCIKIYAGLDNRNGIPFFKQEYATNDIPFWAVPTTAGTGSEATRYAVIYYNGEKQSITDESFIPSIVLMDVSVLTTLPEYQKKSTMMDALCHSIESYWSVNSNEKSRALSDKAIRMILDNMSGYLANTKEGNANLLKAANTAGQAINITQTTAGHAMSYKLTSLYRIAHGHAVALCDAKLFPYMIENTDKYVDPRGKSFLKSIFNSIANAMGCNTPMEACEKFGSIVDSLGLKAPEIKDQSDIALLRDSVNTTRLKNHPILLSKETLEELYKQILGIC